LPRGAIEPLKKDGEFYEATKSEAEKDGAFNDYGKPKQLTCLDPNRELYNCCYGNEEPKTNTTSMPGLFFVKSDEDSASIIVGRTTVYF
jgi:hypothetical protein